MLNLFERTRVKVIEQENIKLKRELDQAYHCIAAADRLWSGNDWYKRHNWYALCKEPITRAKERF